MTTAKPAKSTPADVPSIIETHSLVERELGGKRSGWMTFAGYMCLIGVLVSWVGGSEVVESLQTRAGAAYKKPMTISALNHVGSTLLIPLQSAALVVMGRSPKPVLLYKASACDILSATAAMSFIFLIGDYCWMLSLQYLAVAVASTVFNTSAVFVYVMCVMNGFEGVSIRKVLSVCVALGGVAVISFAGQGAGNDASPVSNATAAPDDAPAVSTTAASVACLISAIFYAAYDVYIKVKTIEWDGAPLIDQVIAGNWMTALVGLWTIPFGAIMLTILAYVPEDWFIYEQFELPTADQSPALFGQASAALGFNMFFALTIILLSPLIYSLGCMLTIPIAAIIDYFFRGQTMHPVAIVGALLVVLGFLALDDNVVESVRGCLHSANGFHPVPEDVKSQSSAHTQSVGRRRSSVMSGRLGR
eukprot:TRINITY_DN9418_c0_g1_i1.p1 TRINITY_DN9418_c0_g1~~TRINITY_DN9418_c0_g1_i1.p1  ORF type:complete len:418 (+),score=94.68 TRINITY_DN9418_c0_g1_i1:90-1343(+)